MKGEGSNITRIRKIVIMGLFIVVGLVYLTGEVVGAQEKEYGDWIYREYGEDNTGVKIIGYKGESAEIDVPVNIEDKEVKGIAIDLRKTKVKKVQLPITIREIGYIYGSLEEIKIHEDNMNFRDYEGYGLYTKDGTKLIKGTEKGEIREGTKIIAKESFLQVDLKGKTVKIPDTVENIQEDSFIGSGLSGVEFPENVEHDGIDIGKSAFLHNGAWTGDGNIEGLEIPPSVRNIGESAFFGAIKQGTVRIRGSLDSIGANAFMGSNNTENSDVGIEEVYIEADVKNMGASIFLGNRLKKISITGKVGDLVQGSDSLFLRNPGIEEIYIGDGVGKLGYNFTGEDLTELKKLYLNPKEIQQFTNTYGINIELDEFEIGPNVEIIRNYSMSHNFYGGNLDLSRVKVLEEASLLQSGFTSVNLPEGDVKKLEDSIFFEGRLENLVVPDNIEIIGKGSFRNNNIKELKLSNNLKKIEKWAFQENKIEELQLPGSMRIIEGNAFEENKIKKLEILDGLVRIEDEAFVENEIKELDFPKSVTYIGGASFNRNNIEKVVIRNRNTEIVGFPFFSEDVDVLDIYGYKGSTAEEFVRKFESLHEENGKELNFIPLEEKEESDIRLSVIGDGLSLEVPDVHDMGDIKVTRKDPVTVGFTGDVNIKDLRGELKGWKLSLGATRLINKEQEHEMVEGSMTIASPKVKEEDNGVLGMYTEDRMVDGTMIDIVTAVNLGGGETRLDFGDDALTIDPSKTALKKGVYEAELRWTLHDTPVGN